VKIRISEIKKTLERVLIKHGIPKEEAKIIADEYLEGELQGKLSHGLMAFPSVIKKISRKREKIKIIKKTNALIFVDANFNFGAVVGKLAVKKAIKMARKEGVALVVIKNLTTWLRPGTIARWIAEKDFIGLVANNGGRPMVAPPGGYEPVIATNPIGRC
jgi:L-2-hydroxycarboxylate dehydrogenase (NAD+)